MNALLNTFAERAKERLRLVEAQHPEVVRLARYLSPAVRVDAPLIRAIRQELMPASDAGLEADLWFSPLVESVSSRGFVLEPRVAEHLRRELAEEGIGTYQAVLNRVAGIIAHEHRSWPPALLLEEQIIWLSLRKYDTESARRTGSLELEALLRQAAKAMSEDEPRGLEIARWAQRALRSLPRPALETDAAILLSLGATARLGGRSALFDMDQQRELPPNVSWILPNKQFATRTTVHLARTTEGVRFGDPDPFSVELSIPMTQPLLVQLSWAIGPVQSVQTVSIGQGTRFVPIPETASDIKVRTLSGEEFSVENAAPSAGGLTPVDLSHACVGVTRYGAKGLRGSLTGFLLGPDLVATVTHGLLDLENDDKLLVRWQSVDIEATVVAMLPATELAVLRLRRSLAREGPTAAVVLPWQPDRVAITPGASWNTVGFDNSSFVEARGTVASTDLQAEAAGLGGLSNGGLVYRGPFLELATQDPALISTAPVAWSGAPIVSSGKVIGMLVAGTSGNKTFYAVPADDLRGVMDAVLVGREALGTVFVSYGGRRRSDKDQAAATRMLDALRSVGLRATFDTDVDETNASRRSLPALMRMANAASSGAVLATSNSHDLPIGQRSLLLLRYRLWLNPGFQLLVFDSNQRQPNKNLLSLNLTGRRVELDSTVQELLVETVRTAYAAPTGVGDESEDLTFTRERDRLALLLRSTDNPGETRIQQIVAALPMGIEEISRIPELPGAVQSVSFRSELTRTAAMFSFPPQTHLPLRQVCFGSSSVRAFSLNASQPSIARAMIDRAWLGRAPPHCFEVGISQLDPSPSVAALSSVLFEQVARSLNCTPEDAQWLLENSNVKFFLILLGQASRAIPLIDELLTRLPGALLFFLLGETAPPRPSAQMMQLPPLRPGLEIAFLRARQTLLTDALSSVPVVPPTPPTDTPPTPRKASKATRKKTQRRSQKKK